SRAPFYARGETRTGVLRRGSEDMKLREAGRARLSRQLEVKGIPLDDVGHLAAVPRDRRRETAAIAEGGHRRLLQPVAEARQDAHVDDVAGLVELDAKEDVALDAEILGLPRVSDRAAAGLGVDVGERADLEIGDRLSPARHRRSGRQRWRRLRRRRRRRVAMR